MRSKNVAVVLALVLGSALVAAPVWAAGSGTSGEGARSGQGIVELAQGRQGGPAEGAGAGRTQDQMRDQAERQQEAAREERERAQEQARERGDGGGPSDNRGLEQQRERVMEQEQKELGRGSEQGQESREQRRKWWRFWE
jgi:hypothetical protein